MHCYMAVISRSSQSRSPSFSHKLYSLLSRNSLGISQVPCLLGLIEPVTLSQPRSSLASSVDLGAPGSCDCCSGAIKKPWARPNWSKLTHHCHPRFYRNSSNTFYRPCPREAQVRKRHQHIKESKLTRFTTSEPNGRYTLLLAVLRALGLYFLAPVVPRLCLTGFTFAQPFLASATIDYIGDTSASRNAGYGLIGAACLVYGGIAVCTAF